MSNDQSFLSSIQKFGKASEKPNSIDLDEAIASISVVLSPEITQKFRKKSDDELPTLELKVYCQDCRKIVPPGIGKTIRGRDRIVCGKCKSRKIARGREDALKKFYHISNFEQKTCPEKK